MAHNHLNIGSDPRKRKAILILSLSRHLTGEPVSAVIAADWSKPKASVISEYFDVVGFDLDPDYKKLLPLRKELGERH
jgi:hypothetical protein